MKLYLYMNSETVWHFQSKELLGEVCILRHWLRHLQLCFTHWPWLVHPVLAISFALYACKVTQIILRPTRYLRRTRMLLFWSPRDVGPNSVIPHSTLRPCNLLFLAQFLITVITSNDLVGQMYANYKWVWIEQGTMSASTFLVHWYILS